MKLIALLMLMTASIAHASPATPEHGRVNWITPTNYSIGGRKVVVTAEGHEYVQIAPKDVGLTAQQILEKYNSAMAELMTDEGDKEIWAQDFHKDQLAGAYTNQGMYNGPRYGFVGFELPHFRPQDALVFRYTQGERRANLDKNISRPQNFARVENAQNQGLLLTGGCKRLPTAEDESDQMVSSPTECFGQLELYIRLDKRN